MNPAIRCRQASIADLPDILRLYAQPALDNGKVLSMADAKNILRRLENYPDYHLYVALKNSRVVGTFALLIMDNLVHAGTPSAVIEAVAVDPSWQHQGVGTYMMRYALCLCQQKGCDKATLSSSLSRPRAHRFYQSLGFELHGYSFCAVTSTMAAVDYVDIGDKT